MKRLDWIYDESRQVGVDFENANEVAQYDTKQGSNRDDEHKLVERLCIMPGQVVVDLGCGTGSFALEAARAGARVRTIDVSTTMLEFLNGAASREGLSDLQVECAGFLTFETALNSFDTVVSRYALHHLPDFWKQAALLCLHDAIRPKGHLYLRDVVFSFEATECEASIENWIRRMPQISGLSRQEFEMHVREEYSTFAWVLEGAGFEIIEREYPAHEYAEYLCSPRRPAT